MVVPQDYRMAGLAVAAKASSWHSLIALSIIIHVSIETKYVLTYRSISLKQ